MGWGRGGAAPLQQEQGARCTCRTAIGPDRREAAVEAGAKRGCKPSSGFGHVLVHGTEKVASEVFAPGDETAVLAAMFLLVSRQSLGGRYHR